MANFPSILRFIPGIKESGGRRISETKLVTTDVNAAAILGGVRILDTGDNWVGIRKVDTESLGAGVRTGSGRE
jgi:hypothetical protein